MKSLSRHQPGARFEDRDQQLHGGPRVGGGFEDHGRPGVQMAGQHGSGILNERQVRYALLQRGRHRDEGHVESLARLLVPRRQVATAASASLSCAEGTSSM